ncbi:hypothetical protein OG592_26995 [Streptomyces avidinii]|uniref:hypothetical protein n=1 Tax=Streptomyces avidinii TaxID=1895 RepID=UPI00386421BC|nr:hypothetical protein OG592_26995 [Streptomyces avidinii]
MADVEVTVSGPLFDGTAEQEFAAYADEAREQISEFAEEHVLTLMGLAFRHPTGYYESHVMTERVAGDTDRVHDSGVVYGPWLEGVGTRNRERPGFPGYFHWRRTKALVTLRAPDMAEQLLQRYLPRVR